MKVNFLNSKDLFAPTVVWLLFGLLSAYLNYYSHGYFNLDQRWDEGYYYSIASTGYSFNGDITYNQNIAFYPVYPIAVKILSFIFFDTDLRVVMYFTSWLFALLASIYLYKIVCFFHSKRIAVFTLIFFFSSPFAFFMFQRFTESMWFCLVFLFFFTLLIKRDLFWSAVIIGIASALRIYGFLLVFVYLFEVFRNKELSKKDAFLNLPLTIFGLMAYTTFQYVKFDHPFLFYYNQIGAWGHYSNNSLAHILYLKGIISKASTGMVNDPIVVICQIFMFSLLIVLISLKKIHPSFVVFFFVLYLFFLTIFNLETIGAMGRYLTVLFPVNIGMAIIVEKLFPVSGSFISSARSWGISIFICLIQYSLSVKFNLDFFFGVFVG